MACTPHCLSQEMGLAGENLSQGREARSLADISLLLLLKCSLPSFPPLLMPHAPLFLLLQQLPW